MKALKKFLKDEQGLELSEYAVMLALIIAALFLAIIALAGAIGNRFQNTADTINNPPAAPGG